MSVTERTYRLRIRNAADDAWEHTFTKFYKPPVVGGQRVYPLQGKTTSKPWVCEIVDDSEDFTAALAEEIGTHWRYTLLHRLADVSTSDDGGAYTVQATGRISDIALGENQATYRITLSDERLVERNSTIFSYANSTTIFPPGTTSSTGVWGHINQVRMTVGTAAHAAPITKLRLLSGGVEPWPAACQTAINNDNVPTVTNMSPGLASSRPGGLFKNLRMRVDGADYPVLGFGYTQDASATEFAVGSNPLHDDDVVYVFVYDPDNDLAVLTDGSGCYLYFGRIDDSDGLDDKIYAPAGVPPTEDAPLHIQGQPFSVLADIYDGVYGGDVVAYDATQMALLQADTRFPPSCAWRITKGNQNMAKAVEELIYKPFLTVPLVNTAGEVFPQPLLLPDATTVPDISALTVLNTSNLTGPVTWEHKSSEQITKIVFRHPHVQTTSGLHGYNSLVNPEYDGPLDRWVGKDVDSSFEFDRMGEFGEAVFDVQVPVVYEEDGTPNKNSGTRPYFEAFKNNFLDRFGDGPVYYSCEVDATVVDAVGDYVVIDCDTTFTPNAGLRAESRMVQIISREVTVAGSKLQMLDAGPYLNAIAGPTVTIVQNATDPRHTLRVTMSGLSGFNYELQMAKATETDWWNVASGDEATVDVGGLKSGTTYYARARTIAPQRIRSDWSASDSAATDAYLAPTAVACSATNNAIVVTWTNTYDNLEMEVYYNTADSLTGATLFETFAAGTTGCTIEALATETLWYVLVLYVGPYGGKSTFDSASDTTGAGENTLTAPDEIYIVVGANIGTRTSP